MAEVHVCLFVYSRSQVDGERVSARVDIEVFTGLRKRVNTLRNEFVALLSSCYFVSFRMI